MSEDNENRAPRPTVRSTSDRPRIGRIGDWNNNSSASSSRSGSRGGIATLGSLGGGSSSSRRRDDDSDDDEGGADMFAGGEKSGLSIQNPGSGGGGPGGLVQGLLRRAAETGQARQNASPSQFVGGGYRLGGEDVETEYIPDPNAEDERNLVTRHVTFWRNGFQLDTDGELRAYDDPQNVPILNMLMQGIAPVEHLDVEDGQAVDLQITKKITEDYVGPAGPRAFVGSGHRLGAPVPEVVSSSQHVPGEFPSAASSAAAEPESITTRFEVDHSQPTTSVQIRLSDGTRLVSRMNLTHTVGDIRNFINASRPENRTRPYVIATTFPNRTLDDDAQTIEAAKLQNSVVVQRWV
ncbi:p47 protein isoform c [Coprinopsis cinerea okayama7|uniref:P47 protein isoform c n=1 Tax=Coprinopsis cinerea (strain Okayama-7 / 130 / ATCC MYA-4618 / FGSC 9003) TaxID=240176 RepID=A8PBW5_COPC7|nr:p47 protein isoform c [Coprinopsis cinerea okayama7\|eukprot:XP_001840282.2 p47 protein isoform c [Coprinopsis cinerea okayama7\